VFPVRYGLYLYVPYGSHNKQRLFPQTALYIHFTEIRKNTIGWERSQNRARRGILGRISVGSPFGITAASIGCNFCVRCLLYNKVWGSVTEELTNGSDRGLLQRISSEFASREFGIKQKLPKIFCVQGRNRNQSPLE
jgi:hypothetical protein